MPDGYGIPKTNRSLLSWSFVEEQMSKAHNFWVSTTRPDGRPHAIPTWGVWLEGRFYFEGSPQTRHMRNLSQNPGIVVHLESGEKVVIIEGEAHEIVPPEPSLAECLSAVFSRQYAWAKYSPTPQAWDAGGLFVVQPKTVLAWSRFPKDATRWRF